MTTEDLLSEVHNAHMREVEARATAKKDVQAEIERRLHALRLAKAEAARAAIEAGATKQQIGFEVGTTNYNTIDRLLEYGDGTA